MKLQHQDREGWQAAQLQRQLGKGGKPPPPPPPIPPVTESATDVEMAARGQREAAARRKGYLSTLLAGGMANAPVDGKKNLLG
jgi:hypothetical protein